MTHRTQLDPLEARRLFSFAAPNLGFGDDGFLAVGKPALVTGQAPNTILALNDGRLIFRDRNVVKYLHGDGAIDAKRATAGTLTIGSNELIAADARTGFVVRVKQKPGQTKATITLYDPKGIAQRTDSTPSDTGVTYRSVAFTADGGFVLVGSKLEVADASHQTATLVVRRFDARLDADGSFGSGGHVGGLDPRTIASQAGLDALTYGTATVDQIGRIYLPYTSRIQNGNGANVFDERVVRLTSNGTLDSTYGTGGVATVYQNDPNLIDGNYQPTTLDRTFDPHTGASYVLWNSYYAGGEGVAGTSLVLSRVAPNGRVSANVTLLPSTSPSTAATGRVALGHDGVVNVVFQDKGAGLTQLRTFAVAADGSLSDPRKTDTFGEASRLPFPFKPNDLVTTPTGTIVMSGLAIDGSGTRTPALYSLYDEVVLTGYTTGKAVELLGDGTLVARGGSGNDTISIVQKHDVVSVTVNKAKPVSFAVNAIRGIVVEGNKGNDRVDLKSTFAPAIIEGGAGNDTLLGSDAGLDTIFGNDGNDQIEGRGGDDQLAGNDGKDTLLGGDGADWLVGGDGNDALYASGFARDAHADDGHLDTLTGGAGADLFRTDRVGSPDPDDRATDVIKKDGDRLQS